MMLSDVCLSVTYIGPKSRTERPRKTKIGTEVADVTRESDTTFKVKGQSHQAASATTFDLLTLKVVSESRVMWATSLLILVLLELGPMYATDRQTDRRQTKASLNASALCKCRFVM